MIRSVHLELGMLVRERRRQPFHGEVEDIEPVTKLVIVRLTVDPRGRPMRRVVRRTYSPDQLVPL